MTTDLDQLRADYVARQDNESFKRFVDACEDDGAVLDAAYQAAAVGGFQVEVVGQLIDACLFAGRLGEAEFFAKEYERLAPATVPPLRLTAYIAALRSNTPEAIRAHNELVRVKAPPETLAITATLVYLLLNDAKHLTEVATAMADDPRRDPLRPEVLVQAALRVGDARLLASGLMDGPQQARMNRSQAASATTLLRRRLIELLRSNFGV